MSIEVTKEILNNSQKDLSMMSGSGSVLIIPSGTLKAITCLDPDVKARIIAKMSNAINDARQIDLKPSK